MHRSTAVHRLPGHTSAGRASVDALGSMSLTKGRSCTISCTSLLQCARAREPKKSGRVARTVYRPLLGGSNVARKTPKFSPNLLTFTGSSSPSGPATVTLPSSSPMVGRAMSQLAREYATNANTNSTNRDHTLHRLHSTSSKNSGRDTTHSVTMPRGTRRTSQEQGEPSRKPSSELHGCTSTRRQCAITLRRVGSFKPTAMVIHQTVKRESPPKKKGKL
mmetsp:Transcript_10172/g.25500  ORF Transcript_10172/g.25500 Transcript_10172/m.25500 type:complete len:219 (+) Transcript_10172:2478-3134(+)